MASKFAGGDPEYIRTTQYGTTDKLAVRQLLHTHYATAPVRWFEWMAAAIPWQSGTVVEVGCGPGNFWEEGRPPVDGEILLTDLSDAMVTSAVERARSCGYEAEGRVAPAESLPIRGRSAAHVISNHMLYHVPHPPDAVAELARVVEDDGLVTVATNGEGHMAELKRIESAVFGTRMIDYTVHHFGLESGLPMLEDAFEEVELHRFPDELRATDARHVLDYLTSYPPGEDATPAQADEAAAMIDEELAAGGGVFTITKDVGLFCCRGPRRR